jgi:hypothetical protein
LAAVLPVLSAAMYRAMCGTMHGKADYGGANPVDYVDHSA